MSGIRQLSDVLDLWEKQPEEQTPTAEFPLQILNAAESILTSEKVTGVDRAVWHRFLNTTAKSVFLKSLENSEERNRWAETVFKVIQVSGYSLLNMLEHRTHEHPENFLFQDMFGTIPVQWTYEQVASHLKEIAAVFYSTFSREPRVAILADNCLEGACCDLACLLYDILDTPLNPHFDENILISIFNRLRITIVVTDTEERRKRLENVRKKVAEPFITFVLDPNIPPGTKDGIFLGEMCKQLSADEIEPILSERTRKALNRVATVMFTSGSTGEPKGVSFSQYNLVSKRFARAAALPGVGEDETLLCYLPLYHTFGRYFEMLGSIYWGGTYVFAGNPSSERLFSLFPEINPSGFISVPIRWVQLHERATKKMAPIQDQKKREEAFRSVVGDRLRWGLSAAGYLSPRVFRFFQNHGVELCSGFGMTEGTGGITMTPPGEYIDNTMGIPLPGVNTRVGKRGELEISGHYIARYLEQSGPEDIIPYPDQVNGGSHWISTGDIFQVSDDGYYRIVDRIKDIYKNSKGQTIAPRRLETKFVGVPGVKHTFLVGEGRMYNVLLIVPDNDDPVVKSPTFIDDPREYFRQLLASANQTLAPFERAVKFTLLDRDFDAGKGELSPKGSYRRKVIEEHFSRQIEALYEGDDVAYTLDDIQIRIPLWFFRDLGVLADDIEVCDEGLFNRRTEHLLTIMKNPETDAILIGDLEYDITGNIIDMDVFTRQPRLWIGNPSLISFCPCKEGWDVPLGNVSPLVLRPRKNVRTYSLEQFPELHYVRDPVLIVINKLISSTLHEDKETAIRAIEQVAGELQEADDRMEEVIWRRLEALSHHPDEDVRCLAYRTLLLHEPDPDYSKAFPTFFLSGLSFLNKESIQNIAFAKFDRRRLEALRKRLFAYRTQLRWPVSERTREQVVNILKLLSEFTEAHPEYYNSVRAELASWALHRSDQKLSGTAENILTDLIPRYEAKLTVSIMETSSKAWASKLVFEDGLSEVEVRQIEKVLVGTTFLKQSIILAFDRRTFDLEDVNDGGIWISRIPSSRDYPCYRMSVNTRLGKHYSLRLVIPGTMESKSTPENIYWHASIRGYPFGSPVLPRLGCYRPDLGAYSSRYLGDLTVWEHIRQYAGNILSDGSSFPVQTIRKLFIQGLEAFFRGWDRSGRKIVPGAVSPDNVAVPEMDFRENGRVLSLTAFSPYKNGLSLIKPMLRNFYSKTLAHYPSYTGLLEGSWIFDACVEALGEKSAELFLEQLTSELEEEPLECPDGIDMRSVLEAYRHRLASGHYVQLPLKNAIEEYTTWAHSNPRVESKVKEQSVLDLYHAFGLGSYPEFVRYFLYRNTYFADAEPPVIEAFDRLLSRMRMESNRPAVQLVALSDLQAALSRSEDREVFSRLIFPRLRTQGKVDVLKIGESGIEQVIVRSTITDRNGEVYTCREALEPVEIGELYRLFFLEHQQMDISTHSRHSVVIDSREEIIGGVCFTFLEETVAEIEGIIVASQLKGRGIGKALLEDFCARMAGHGVRIVKTPLLTRGFFLECGFKTDRRWSGFVKILFPDEDTSGLSFE